VRAINPLYHSYAPNLRRRTLASTVPGGDDYHTTRKAVHRRIEQLLLLIDRRGASDPQMPALFQELQDVVRSHNARQQVLFSDVRTALSEDDAQRVRSDLQAAVDTAMTRPTPIYPMTGRSDGGSAPAPPASTGSATGPRCANSTDTPEADQWTGRSAGIGGGL